jgi:hypothetical protein
MAHSGLDDGFGLYRPGALVYLQTLTTVDWNPQWRKIQV